MKSFKNFNDLKKQIESDIKKKINNTLENEVSDVAKRIVQEHIDSDIYGAGDPIYYRRRYYDTGLIDESNLHVDVNDCELRISNVTSQTGGDIQFHGSLSNMLIDGYKNRHGTVEWYNKPRPYMENTNRDLENNEEIQGALDRGLERQGIRRVK